MNLFNNYSTIHDFPVVHDCPRPRSNSTSEATNYSDLEIHDAQPNSPPSISDSSDICKLLNASDENVPKKCSMKTQDAKAKNMLQLKRILLSPEFEQYAKYFLGCERCGTSRPHCVCGGLNGCINECPNLSKCTKDKRQLSHCPTCMHIGKGISPHRTFSYSIDVYICANCAQFYSFWSTNSQEIHNKLASLKCESRWAKKGNCFRYQQCNFIKLSEQNLWFYPFN